MHELGDVFDKWRCIAAPCGGRGLLILNGKKRSHHLDKSLAREPQFFRPSLCGFNVRAQLRTRFNGTAFINPIYRDFSY